MTGLFARLFGRRHLEVAAVSDAGLVRTDNQDCLFVDGGHRVFCVADGMGGAEGGALASRMVCEAVAGCTAAHDFVQRIKAADAAIGAANARILAHAREHGLEKMGTTVALILFDPSDLAQAAIGHAGDTRVYRRRGPKLERLTADHRKSAYSHFLTKAVGVQPTVEPDWLHASVKRGDIWLVCCDGVHDMLPDSTINGILARGGSAREMADRLSEAVRRAGALDNYTFILIRA